MDVVFHLTLYLVTYGFDQYHERCSLSLIILLYWLLSDLYFCFLPFYYHVLGESFNLHVAPTHL